MVDRSRAIDEVLRAMGAYYAVPGRSGIRKFLPMGGDPSAPVELEDFRDRIHEILMRKDSASPSLFALIHEINEQLQGPGGAGTKGLRDACIITYEPSTIVGKNPQGAAKNVPMALWSGQEIHQQGQWSIKRGRGEFKKRAKAPVVSIKEVLGKSASEGINKDVARPSTSSPTLGIVQVFRVDQSPASRETGAVQFFLNGIPTIDMSLCVPFFRLSILIPGPTTVENRLQGLTLASSILGHTSVDETDSVTMMLATAKDIESGMDQLRLRQQRLAEKDNSSSESKTPISSRGMEIFTMPQTLTPLTNGKYSSYKSQYENWYPTTDGSSWPAKSSTEPRAQTGGSAMANADNDPEIFKSTSGRNPVLDPFRPLATIRSFSIDSSSKFGAISFKKANLELTIHDRSRMSELAPFVQPDIWGSGKVRMLIEYGWSHPHGDGFQPSAGNSKNYFGKFLNAMREQEVYGVSSSSFQFDQHGGVDVVLTLQTAGADELESIYIIESGAVQTIGKNVATLVEDINSAREVLDRQTGATQRARAIGSNTFLNSLRTTSDALMADDEIQKAAKEFWDANSNATSPAVQNLNKALKSLFKKPGGTKNVQQAKLQNSAAAHLQIKLRAVKSTPDPYLLPIGVDENGKVNGIISRFLGKEGVVNPWLPDGKKKYISLGKLLLHWVGVPLASSNRFAEVQMIFYACNAKASFVRDFNLAQFPVNITDFTNSFKQVRSRVGAQMTVAQFLDYVAKLLVNNQGCKPYGMQGMYDSFKGDKYVQKDEYEDSSSADTYLRRVLRTAYNIKGEETAESLVFKPIKLSYHLESVAMLKETDKENTPFSFRASPDTKDTVLRIHIYDAQHEINSFATEALRARYDDHLGSLIPTATSVTTQVKAGKAGDKVTVTHAVHFYETLAKMVKDGVITGANDQVSSDLVKWHAPGATEMGNKGEVEDLRNNLKKVKWKYMGQVDSYKKFLSTILPTIRIGINNSLIKEASMETINSGLMAAVSYQRANRKGAAAPPASSPDGFPLQTNPTRMSLTTMGCPFFQQGQEFFVDFGTNTSIDNVYRVVRVTHTIEEGEFTSHVDLMNTSVYGRVTVFSDSIVAALGAMGTETS